MACDPRWASHWEFQQALGHIRKRYPLLKWRGKLGYDRPKAQHEYEIHGWLTRYQYPLWDGKFPQLYTWRTVEPYNLFCWGIWEDFDSAELFLDQMVLSIDLELCKWAMGDTEGEGVGLEFERYRSGA